MIFPLSQASEATSLGGQTLLTAQLHLTLKGFRPWPEAESSAKFVEGRSEVPTAKDRNIKC